MLASYARHLDPELTEWAWEAAYRAPAGNDEVGRRRAEHLVIQTVVRTSRAILAQAGDEVLQAVALSARPSDSGGWVECYRDLVQFRVLARDQGFEGIESVMDDLHAAMSLLYLGGQVLTSCDLVGKAVAYGSRLRRVDASKVQRLAGEILVEAAAIR